MSRRLNYTKDQCRQADQKEIHPIGLPIDSYAGSHKVKSQHNSQDQQVQEQEHPEIPPYLPDHIFGITERPDIKDFGSIELLVPF